MKQTRNLLAVLLISCVGFLCGGIAEAATPSFTISVTASPASLTAKQIEALTVTAISNIAASGYNIVLTVTTNGVQETSKTFSSLNFKANTALTEKYSWTVPSTAPLGIYTVTARIKKNSIVYATATTTFTVISNGVCGSSNGTNLTSAPTTNLCSIGTASTVSGTGPWAWTCAGVGGSTASCSANLMVNGVCGPSSGTTLSSAPTSGLCNSGSTTAVAGTGPWTWSCLGINGGTSQNCSAALLGAPVNGACGTANGVAVASAPTTNLCNATGTIPNVSGSGPWAWTCTGTNGGTNASCSAPLATSNCPFAANAASLSLMDGCAGAPSGTPQLPNLLSGYGTKRPTWDVAGVDYPVGVPAGIALADPTTAALPSGCSYSGNIVNCSGNNITVSGYNFSLHGGIQLNISGSNNVVKNNNFAASTSCIDPELVADASGTWTITNNNFDGGGAGCVAEVDQPTAWGGVVSLTSESGSVVTFTYNYFLNSPQDAFDGGGPSSGSAQVIMQYNVWNGLGWTGHPDGYQLCGGNYTNNLLGFNTYYEPSNILFGEQPFHVEAQCGSTVTNAVVDYNTLVTPGTCGQGPWPQGCTSSAADIACKQDSGNINTGFKAYGNYLDWSGAGAALDNGYGCQNTTWGTLAAPNMDMTTGAVIPNPGTN